MTWWAWIALGFLLSYLSRKAVEQGAWPGLPVVTLLAAVTIALVLG